MSEYAPSDATFSRNGISLRIAEHTLEGFIDENDRLVYALRLNEELPGGDRISGMLRFSSPKPNKNLWKNLDRSQAGDAAHQWNLVQPLAQVKGVLSVSKKR